MLRYVATLFFLRFNSKTQERTLKRQKKTDYKETRNQVCRKLDTNSGGKVSILS